MTKKKWTKDDMPSLSNKTAIVTGANSGLGFEVTKGLAAKEAHVILACRNIEKGEAAAKSIYESYTNSSLKVMHLDLADLSSVRAFVKTFKNENHSLDILCNNAGIMFPPYIKTVDNFELQFGVNYLGHFALTGLLLDLLLQTEGARVVSMSSITHTFGKIDFENLNWEKPKSYRLVASYGRSKLANLMFAYELQRKLENKGAKVISVASHPGYAATPGQTTGLKMNKSISSKMILLFIKLLTITFAQSAEMGALPMLYAATCPDIKGGEYIGPTRVMNMRGYPKKVRSNKESYDLDVAKRLWEISEELTGVRYESLN
ncbi:MAG: oxidoreductase [Promethearchaeota archaeon]